MSGGSWFQGPSGSSGAPTGSINRDSGTSRGNLGISKNDECLEDRGLGAFLSVSGGPAGPGSRVRITPPSPFWRLKNVDSVDKS